MLLPPLFVELIPAPCTNAEEWQFFVGQALNAAQQGGGARTEEAIEAAILAVRNPWDGYTDLPLIAFCSRIDLNPTGGNNGAMVSWGDGVHVQALDGSRSLQQPPDASSRPSAFVDVYVDVEVISASASAADIRRMVTSHVSQTGAAPYRFNQRAKGWPVRVVGLDSLAEAIGGVPGVESIMHLYAGTSDPPSHSQATIEIPSGEAALLRRIKVTVTPP